MYTQLGVLTKGTVIEVNVSELGTVTTGGKVVFGKYAQITNNPENDGCVNAVLREFPCSFASYALPMTVGLQSYSICILETCYVANVMFVDACFAKACTRSMSTSNSPAPGTSRHALTPLDRQRSQLERLLKDPSKAAYIPPPPKEKMIRPAREMMKNVQGSSAGAGSGEFHVYKASRRREYERLKIMEEEAINVCTFMMFLFIKLNVTG